MSSDLMPQFEANLAKVSLSAEERILVAVSGGPDSMALLHLFLRWGKKRIGVFHLNHCFRPEAEQEAVFVENYARRFGVPAYVTAYDINRYLKESGESKQQGARRIRYRLLRKYARQYGYHRIALGHHGDDQAETVLMRLLRGSGLHGLSGIPLKRGRLIRPLLTAYKEDILNYCQQFEVPYVEDASNLEAVYLRNKIRHELLPLLEREYNPEIKTQLLQLAELARADELELQNRAEQICKKNSRWERGQLRFKRCAFPRLSASMQRRVLRTLLLNYRGHLLRVGFKHIENWRRQLLENTAFYLSLPGVQVSANADYIFVGKFEGEEWEPRPFPLPGAVETGSFIITAEIFAASALPPKPDCSEDFDLDRLRLPLLVRPREDGDRLRVFGGAGSKKVKDLLIEARVPLEQRDYLPVVCDQRDILWIPTIRRSDSAPLDEHTKHVVRLTFSTTFAS